MSKSDTVDIQNGHDFTNLEHKSTNILDRQGFRVGMDKSMLSLSHFHCVFV